MGKTHCRDLSAQEYKQRAYQRLATGQQLVTTKTPLGALQGRKTSVPAAGKSGGWLEAQGKSL
jgi:hypothetical protein